MKPMMPFNNTGYSQAGYGSNTSGEYAGTTEAPARQPSYTSPASEAVTTANAGIEQEVFANKAIEPESDALSTAAQADSAQEFAPQPPAQTAGADQAIAPEGRGSYLEEEVAREIPGQVTSTPQLAGDTMPEFEGQGNVAVQDHVTASQPVAVSEPVTVEEPVVAETAREVPIETVPQENVIESGRTGPSLTATPTFGAHLACTCMAACAECHHSVPGHGSAAFQHACSFLALLCRCCYGIFLLLPKCSLFHDCHLHWAVALFEYWQMNSQFLPCPCRE